MPTPKALEDFAQRRLSAEDFTAYVDAPVSDREREEILGLIRWFRRRYPTPAARLASNRRAFRAAARRRGIALPG